MDNTGIQNISLTLYQDRTFQQNFYYADQNGVAIDISTWTFSSVIRKLYDDQSVVATFVFTTLGLPTGNVRMSLDPATTALIPVPQATAPGVYKASKYSYDIQVTMASGAKFTQQLGTVYFNPSVTRF